MFDPEKVERFEFWANADEGDMEPNANGKYVLFSAYDQLRELYRASEKRLETITVGDCESNALRGGMESPSSYADALKRALKP